MIGDRRQETGDRIQETEYRRGGKEGLEGGVGGLILTGRGLCFMFLLPLAMVRSFFAKQAI